MYSLVSFARMVVRAARQPFNSRKDVTRMVFSFSLKNQRASLAMKKSEVARQLPVWKGTEPPNATEKGKEKTEEKNPVDCFPFTGVIYWRRAATSVVGVRGLGRGGAGSEAGLTCLLFLSRYCYSQQPTTTKSKPNEAPLEPRHSR